MKVTIRVAVISLVGFIVLLFCNFLLSLCKCMGRLMCGSFFKSPHWKYAVVEYSLKVFFVLFSKKSKTKQANKLTKSTTTATINYKFLKKKLAKN